MTSDEFKNDALRTESRPEKLNFSKAGTVTLLIACVETAKIADMIKKTMFYGKPLNVDALRDKIDELRMTLGLLGDTASKISDTEYDIDQTTGEEIPFHAPNMRILHGAIGMFGESGELIEAVARQMSSGKIDMVNVAEECGDSDWYKAIIHDETGISEDVCRAKVVAKLKLRYGDKFSSEAALNRDLAAERVVLEETQG